MPPLHLPKVKTIAELASLEGRRALVTGAAGNIGRVIAQTLAELGADLVLVDRPGSSYDVVLREVGERRKVDVRTIDCDLESAEGRASLVASVRSAGGRLDILVNNA